MNQSLPKLRNLRLESGSVNAIDIPQGERRTLVEPVYKAMLVTIDGLTEPVLAYTTGKTWNGFECPKFPADSVVKIVEAFEKDEHFILDFVDNQRVYKVDMGHDMSEAECMLPVDILVDGRLVNTWSIGSSEWCWVKVEKPTHYQLNTPCCSATVELRSNTNLLHVDTGLFDVGSAYDQNIVCSDCGKYIELDECGGKKMITDPREV